MEVGTKRGRMKAPMLLLLVGCFAAAGCAGAPRAAPEVGEPLLLLPLRNRGGLSAAELERAEKALRSAVRRAGRSPVAMAPCLEEPCPRPPLGDEPDAELSAHAAAAGAPSLLAGWAAALPDGSIAWMLRLVEVPADESNARAETPEPSPSLRTVDRAGGQARNADALGTGLASAAKRLLAGPPEPSPRGQRTASDLARRLRARTGLFDACLAERLLAVPDLVGVAILQLVVDVRGEVRDVRFAGSSFGDPSLEACLSDAATQIDFPAGVGGSSVLEQRLFWPRPVAAADGR